MHSAVTTCDNHGDVEIVGIVTESLAVGHLVICVEGVKRAVYDESWGAEEAAIVCQNLQFPPEGMC